MKHTKKTKDEVGNRYGRLIVIEYAGVNKFSSAMWLCKCDCGKTTCVSGSSLRKGHTKSCGCLNDDVRRIACKERRTTHGMSNTRLYHIWNNMKQRINNPNQQRFKQYGGRGITLCQEWQQFENFENWAMSNGYTDKLTIDRIDNNGPYSPDNCRWATYKAQENNKSDNVFLVFNGKKQTIAQWAHDMNIKRTTL